MKLWGVMLMSALTLSSVNSIPLVLQNPHRAKHFSSSEPQSQKSERLNFLSQYSLKKQDTQDTEDLPNLHPLKHLESHTTPHSESLTTPHLHWNEEVFDMIHRMKRSVKRRGTRNKMAVDRKRANRDERERGRGGRACALKQVQLKVSDLGLGYQSQEELIFSYCSGVCINSFTNYDKIITSLVASGKTVLRNSPLTACCRPIEYDDNLSFLDDNLIYHTMERHSARKCGCV